MYSKTIAGNEMRWDARDTIVFKLMQLQFRRFNPIVTVQFAISPKAKRESFRVSLALAETWGWWKTVDKSRGGREESCSKYIHEFWNWVTATAIAAWEKKEGLNILFSVPPPVSVFMNKIAMLLQQRSNILFYIFRPFFVKRTRKREFQTKKEHFQTRKE